MNTWGMRWCALQKGGTSVTPLLSIVQRFTLHRLREFVENQSSFFSYVKSSLVSLQFFSLYSCHASNKNKGSICEVEENDTTEITTRFYDIEIVATDIEGNIGRGTCSVIVVPPGHPTYKSFKSATKGKGSPPHKPTDLFDEFKASVQRVKVGSYQHVWNPILDTNLEVPSLPRGRSTKGSRSIKGSRSTKEGRSIKEGRSTKEGRSIKGGRSTKEGSRSTRVRTGRSTKRGRDRRHLEKRRGDYVDFAVVDLEGKFFTDADVNM